MLEMAAHLLILLLVIEIVHEMLSKTLVVPFLRRLIASVLPLLLSIATLRAISLLRCVIV